MERGLGDDIEELKKEIKRLRDLNDKAIAYEFGENDKRVQVVKDEKVWRVRDIHGGNLTKDGKFVPIQCGNTTTGWSKEHAIREAQNKAKADK